jgi:hypothetical protein
MLWLSTHQIGAVWGPAFTNQLYYHFSSCLCSVTQMVFSSIEQTMKLAPNFFFIIVYKKNYKPQNGKTKDIEGYLFSKIYKVEHEEKEMCTKDIKRYDDNYLFLFREMELILK